MSHLRLFSTAQFVELVGSIRTRFKLALLLNNKTKNYFIREEVSCQGYNFNLDSGSHKYPI